MFDFRQSALSFMIGSNSDRSVFKARPPEPRKTINVYAHHDDLWSFAQLAISVPDWRKGLISDRTRGQRTNTYKKQGTPDRRSLTQQKLRLFTCVASHIKTQGAPDRRSLTQQKLRLFTCVAPHTKSKGLPVGGPLLSKNLGFLHV
jgi:hypothetical protein